jgi:predicted AlkP superfamily pyrophosphatase or phosphodiesterase
VIKNFYITETFIYSTKIQSDMIPNYKQNNIINLMSSILHGLGSNSKYPQLNKELTKEIKEAKNVVLMVIDGVGTDSLKKLGKKSFLVKNKVQDLQSIFPSTTAAAVTTFYTGLAPQEHGVTGWYMNMKEFGAVVCLLRFITRMRKKIELLDKDPYLPKAIFDKIKVKSYKIGPESIFKSPYNQILGKNASLIGYRSLNGFFNKINQTIKSSSKRKFIYAYWPDFDSLSHLLGKNSKEAKDHLKAIDEKMEKFVKKLEGTNTLLLITADHGQIVTTRKKAVIANEHPLLKECLSAPLCGEPRAAYCYVYPRKVKQFESYVKNKLSKYCELHKSEDLVKAGYFGLGRAHPRLLDRVGDYTLIMKKDHIIKDFLINEEFRIKIGDHGGVSEEEMIIPLIKIRK